MSGTENEEGTGDRWKTCSVRLKQRDWDRALEVAKGTGMVSDQRGVGIWLRKAILDAINKAEEEAA